MAYTLNVSTTTPHQKTILDAVKTTAESLANPWTSVYAPSYNDGTRTRYVFKSPGTDPADSFYVVFWYHNTGATTTTAGINGNGLFVTVCEDYNATTHELTKPAVFGNATCATGNDGINGGPYSLADTITNCGWIGARSSTGYWTSGKTAHISVFSDGIAMTVDAGSTTSSCVLYAGKFTSLIKDADTLDTRRFAAVALGAANNYSGGSSGSWHYGIGGATRSARNAGKAAHSWALAASPFHTFTSPDNPAIATAEDSLQDGPVFSPVVLSRVGRATDGYLFGGLRARLPHVAIYGSNAGTYGDTFDISGDDYISAADNGGRSPAYSYLIEKG